MAQLTVTSALLAKVATREFSVAGFAYRPVSWAVSSTTEGVEAAGDGGGVPV
jgi:hypothetical protein